MEPCYTNFKDVISDLESSLEEFGKDVDLMKEITNTFYTVFHPYLGDLNPQQPWSDVEFSDRVSKEPRNPGNAWKHLPEVWQPMMEPIYQEGREPLPHYSYTYAERMCGQLQMIVDELRENPGSRQAYIAIWNPSIDPFRFSRSRIPCSLGYQFFLREGKLNMTYFQRSCNFKKHFQNDIYLAFKLQVWVAKELKVEVGSFSHWIGSFHIFT